MRLGGYVILPRLLDKGRATLAGTNGEYIYDCPNDKLFFSFVGLNANALKDELAKGKSDSEILAWIQEHAQQKRVPFEIEAWSAMVERRAPDNLDSRAHFNELHKQVAPQRRDIVSWFDLLDVDDYVSFGGNE